MKATRDTLPAPVSEDLRAAPTPSPSMATAKKTEVAQPVTELERQCREERERFISEEAKVRTETPEHWWKPWTRFYD